MQASSIGAFAPIVLLCAALGSWSLISLLFLLAFFIVQYHTQRRAPETSPKPVLWISVVLLATTVICTEGIAEIIWALLGSNWSLDSAFLELLGLSRLNPWQGSLGVFLSLLPQFAVALIAASALYQEQHINAVDHLGLDMGSSWRGNLRYFVLPTLQIFVGVARPSWISLPYFVCSCVGLLHWSITGTNVGLSWTWRPLLWCTGIHIFLLYLYQLPISFLAIVSEGASYFGLFKVSEDEIGWPEGVQAASLIGFYMMLCFAINDLEGEHLSLRSTNGGSSVDELPRYYSDIRPPQSAEESLMETLLPSELVAPDSETIPLSRRWDADQRRALVFRHATINFITYGFPICLIALVSWSFIYTSLCAFGLLLYVGYIFYAFPSIHTLRQLNPILLGFILSWTLSTYVFNAAFSFISEKSEMGMEIWHSIGLWHYLTPGLFILAQFALGLLVATDIFVSNVIIESMVEAESPPNDDPGPVTEDQEDWKVLVMAVVAWCLRRSAHVISLILILIVGMKEDLLHAVYIGFFLTYLVSSEVARSTRQHLILFSELHFGALYLLQLDWISETLEKHEAQLKPILLQLGLWNKGNLEDFLTIALLVCFLAVQQHGVKVLSSLSATVQQSPYQPLGWGVLTVGNRRSVLLSVYASQNFGHLQQESSSDVNWVTKHLASMAEVIRATYRSFGTYIAYGTVLTVIDFVEPNYISLGYICLLLFWVIGRQIMGHTESPLWYPVMVFAGFAFVFRYTLSAFPDLQKVLSERFSLHDDFGFDTGSSLVGHLWDSLAILTAMQLYRFERGQSSITAEAQNGVNFQVNFNQGHVGFIRRVLILHSGKILMLTVFYSSITPVSATGFIYLLILIATCNMSKTSRLPGQLYSFYTGVLVIAEYLFQMLGDRAQMFPGQSHGEFAYWLGFRVYEQGFLGTELGLRSKVLVLVACILQYSSFYWLSQLPASLCGDSNEPCLLFRSYRAQTPGASQVSSQATVFNGRSQDNGSPTGSKTVPSDSDVRIVGQSGILRDQSSKVANHSDKAKLPKIAIVGLDSTDFRIEGNLESVGSGGRDKIPHKSQVRSPWGSAKESRRWTKQAGLLVKQERYEAQVRTLSIYVKHILEHFFEMFGLEISMLSLLVASFILLNITSLFYVLILGLCILLGRQTLHTTWPLFIIFSACALVTEYVILGNAPPSWASTSVGESEFSCNSCVYGALSHSAICWRCWLGLVVDDRSIVAAHFMVFFITGLWLRVNMQSGRYHMQSIHSAIVPAGDRLAWKEMSFESSCEWTWFDHVRFYFYRHLLHIVLLLVFATGTLQYDVLHLGYLTFSLVLFRMRSTLMVKRNSIFRFLRLYNFILIGASLIYQAPQFGSVPGEGCAVLLTDVYNIVGLYKMKFGFRITGRSAIVDIIIFCATALQSYIFRSREFEQLLRYLESEKVEARAHAQEHKAAWKKEHLQRIRETEEQKLQRRLQVEKMKTDMFHLQLQLDVLDSSGKFNEVVSPMIELNNRRTHYPSFNPSPGPRLAEEATTSRSLQKSSSDSKLQETIGLKQNPIVVLPGDLSEGPGLAHHGARRRIFPQVEETSVGSLSITGHGESSADTFQSKILHGAISTPEGQFPSVVRGEASSSSQPPVNTENTKKYDENWQMQGILPSVQQLGDGLAQVHDLGNKALANLVGLFNLEQAETDDVYFSLTDDETRTDNKEDTFKSSQNVTCNDDLKRTDSEAKLRITDTWRRVCMLYIYFWVQVSSNTDIVCYVFFIIAYIWDFSFLTLVYPAVLFLYALLANPGPSQQFWFYMLVYTELNILLQYMYQIHVQNCDGQDVSLWLQKLGIPGVPMDHSFVISVLPLFLVYLTTLVQSSIKARDGEWMFVDDIRTFPSTRRLVDTEGQIRDSYAPIKERLRKVVTSGRDTVRSIGRGLWRYFQALLSGSEAPPHFVQVSLQVGKWPEDGIQPERIESGFNKLLEAVHETEFSEGRSLSESVPGKMLSSRVCVESIENNPENPSMALAVLEVIYAAPRKGQHYGDHQTLTPAADVASELQRAKDEGQLEETDFPYPIISIIPGGKREVDLYAIIFGIDLISFLYVGVLYQSTVKHSTQIIDVSQVEDQFPKEFVIVLMTMFFLIMVDRVFYLYSLATGKVIYYFFSLALYTSYLWSFVWEILSVSGADHARHFRQLLPLRGIFLLKALSLSLQAVQLRYGLPHRSTLSGQFLTRNINLRSWLGFILYRSLPFLYELRCLLDWSCTTTSLSLYDWLKLEDIYASLFLVQCTNKMVRGKHRFGHKQGVCKKFGSGVLLFLTLIGIIWAPMLIYSSGNPTNVVNEIIDVRVHIEVKTGGVKFSLFETGLCQVPFFSNVREAGNTSGGPEDPYTYLASYDLRDVQLICCEKDSDSLWMIPPPTLKNLLESVNEDLAILTRWEFNRRRPKGKEITVFSTDPADPTYEINSTLVAHQFRGVLNGTLSSFKIPKMYPRYFRVPGTGDVRILETAIKDSLFVSGNLSLNEEGSFWWSFERADSDDDDGCGKSKGPMAITVSEEVPTGIIGETLSKFSIWSLYITFVLAVGRFFRLQYSDIRMRIPFENFPSCHRLVAICEDIYAARAEKELELEEGLFWTIIKIYRSPHILMEYTKVE